MIEKEDGNGHSVFLLCKNLPFCLESLGCSWQTRISGAQGRVLSAQGIYLHIFWQLMKIPLALVNKTDSLKLVFDNKFVWD